MLLLPIVAPPLPPFLPVSASATFTIIASAAAAAAVAGADKPPLLPLEEERLDDFLFLDDVVEFLLDPSFQAGLDDLSAFFLLEEVVVGTTTFLLPLLPYALSNAVTRSRRRRAAGSHDLERSRLFDTLVFRNACREGDPLNGWVVLPWSLPLPCFVFLDRPIRPRWFNKSGDSPPDSGPGTTPPLPLEAPLPDRGSLNCDSTNSGAKRAVSFLRPIFFLEYLEDGFSERD